MRMLKGDTSQLIQRTVREYAEMDSRGAGEVRVNDGDTIQATIDRGRKGDIETGEVSVECLFGASANQSPDFLLVSVKVRSNLLCRVNVRRAVSVRLVGRQQRDDA